MLIVTNRQGTVLEKRTRGLFRFSRREKESEGKSVREKQVSSSSHPLPWAPNPTCVSKRREQTPKINRWSQTQSITSSPTKKKKKTLTKKKRGKVGKVCVQCVVRPGVCVYVQGTAKVSQIYA